MNNTHKTILKVIFLVIVPTLIFATWSRGARVKVKRLPPPAPLMRAMAPVRVPHFDTPYLASVDLAKSNLWTVDDRGSLLRFSNEGPESWNNFDGLGKGAQISFIDARNGWAFLPSAYFYNFWRTTDGGKSWKVLPGGTGPGLEDQPRRLKFFNEKLGWFLDGNRLWRTDNGGRSWAEITYTQPPVTDINDLAFIDARTLIAAQSDGEVAMTTDAGKTWRISEVAGLYRLATNGKLAWGVGLDNTVFQSGDNGRTWVELSRIHSPAVVLSLQFVDQLEGWAAGYLSSGTQTSADVIDRNGVGVLFHTVDGGTTWEQSYPPKDINFTRVAFLNSRSGWLVGHNGVYQTHNGGRSWNHLMDRSVRAAISK